MNNEPASSQRPESCLQTIPTARNAHAIRTDNTNRYAFVPHLGTDQVFQFLFDPKSGRLTANTPPLIQLKAGTGPRHLVHHLKRQISGFQTRGEAETQSGFTHSVASDERNFEPLGRRHDSD